LGERLVRNQQVSGSIPLTSTKKPGTDHGFYGFKEEPTRRYATAPAKVVPCSSHTMNLPVRTFYESSYSKEKNIPDRELQLA
jgi:hypothetical protein